MKVMISGAGGFVGSHIADLLIEAGHEVGIIDNLSSGTAENVNPAARFWRLNIISPQCRIPFAEFKPDVICHQAAQPSLRLSIESPTEDAMTNVIGTLHLIELAREFKCQHFVLASTSAIYNADGLQPYLEDDEAGPRVPYGIAKYTSELYLINSGLSYTVLRYGNIYGERQKEVNENQLVPHCLNYLLLGRPFVINGDGEQTRDFVYVGDIARANVAVLEKRPQGTFNCGTGKSHSVNYVCSMLKRICQQPTVQFEHAPAKPNEPRHVCLNSTLAHETFGWQAETPLAHGLAKTVEAWRKL